MVDRAHAAHSPSSLKEKAKCPGWRNDETRDKTAANRGTLGHKAVEENKPELCGEDQALRDAVLKLLALRENLLRTMPKAKVVKEIRVEVLDQFGYIDEFWFDEETKSGVLLDYKFAMSPYSADSPQFWGYCLGLFAAYPVDKIRVIVANPFRDEVDCETFTRSEHLDLFTGKVSAIIESAKRDDPATYRAGDACAWCRRAGTCPALMQIAVSSGREIAPDKITLPAQWDPALINDPQTMAKALALANLLANDKDGWATKVRSAATKMVSEQGMEIPGYSLIEAKSPRVVSNVTAAYEAVKDRVDLSDFLAITSIGIGDLEKVFSKHAPKGKKAQWISELDERLREIEALEQGKPFLRLSKDRK